MKRLIITGLVFGCALGMAQKREDFLQIQRDLADLRDQVQQLKKAQDDQMAKLQSMLQQAVDASAHVGTGLTTIQKEIDNRLADQQTKLVAPVATVGAKVDQMADDLRSVSVNVADLSRKMDSVLSQIKELSEAVRSMPPPSAPPPAAGATGAPGGTQVPVPTQSADQMYTQAYGDYQSAKQDLAMQEFNDIVKYYPGTDSAAKAQYYIGYMYFNANQYDDAAKAFEVLLAMNENGKTPDGLYYKAVSLQKSQHLTAAKDAYNEYLRRYPTGDHAAMAKRNLISMGFHPPGTQKKRSQ